MNKRVQAGSGLTAAPAFLIEDIYPSVDGGRFPVKRIVGETVEVWADIFRDGEAVTVAVLLWKRDGDIEWQREPMREHGNDRWTASFIPRELGRHHYAIEAWTDEFATWRRDFERKREAGLDTPLDALEGASLLPKATSAKPEAATIIIETCEDFLRSADAAPLLSPLLANAMMESQHRVGLTVSRSYPLMIDRPIARNGAWYEMVPRSQGTVPGRHGTFSDCIARVPEIAAMGFDVVCLAPIHPIGTTNRNGRNDTAIAAPGDPGSMYAIGSAEGGHDAVHPELGTLDDFRNFVRATKQHGMEVALDVALQFSPDHPWLREHRDWFRSRPDGSVRFAENSPIRQSIIDLDFDAPNARALWIGLRDVVLFWVAQGVRIFRADSPHTKPFSFWEWLIAEVQARHPDTIFLAKAFARPKLMNGLAKLGFTQSYSDFTWRIGKSEIEDYLRELTDYPKRAYFRANLFVNTPDILPYHLQGGEAWMFKSRVALAGTLSSTYGIYNGFELLEHEPVPGKEEYINSEIYEIKVRDWDKPGHIKDYIRKLNEARRNNPALQQTEKLRLVGIEDPNVIGFVKESVDGRNMVAVAIALSENTHDIWYPIGDREAGPPDRRRKITAVEDILTGERHTVEWGGVHLRIDPARDPAILLRCLA